MGAQSSQSNTMSVTLCKAMYFSAVMKVLSSRGSCTSRSQPHFSHASGIHWRGSEVVVMPTSSQPAAVYPFGRTGQIPGAGSASRLKGSSSCRAATASRPRLRDLFRIGGPGCIDRRRASLLVTLRNGNAGAALDATGNGLV